MRTPGNTSTPSAQTSPEILGYRWCGLMEYNQALREQHRVRDAVDQGAPPQILGLVHEPVFTLGRRGSEQEVLNPGDIPIVRVDRGGRATYHGPGQAVLYPIIKLSMFKLGVRDFVTLLEEASIRWLNERDILAARDQVNPGVWVDTSKIAAIGIHVRRDITTHGMAINVRTDLSVFDRFIPCGLAFHGVDRVVDHMGDKTPTEQEVALGIATTLAELLNVPLGEV